MSRAGIFTMALAPGSALVLGRASDCDVPLEDAQLSRRHARIQATTGGCEVADLGSRNGTQVAGARIPADVNVALKPGDLVTLGSVIVRVEPGSPIEARRLLAPEAFDALVDARIVRARAAGAGLTLAQVRFELEPLSFGTRTTASSAAAIAQQAIVLEARQCALLALPHLAAITARATGVYELALDDADDDVARSVREELRVRPGALDVHVACGTAQYPRDGQARQTLQAHAARSLRSLEDLPSKDAQLDRGAMARLAPLIARVAASTIGVLVLGETGVGKEVMARTLHTRGARAGGPFVAVNCAAFSEALLESELFGHERGAFTGAVAAKAGLLEAAHGGTFFLDEVGEMPPSLQAKLLRVLEQREVLRVGATTPHAIDVRFIAATNRNLDDEVAAGRFRRDLLFRLNAIELRIPPLRERSDEIADLARVFAEQATKLTARTAAPAISAEVIRVLEAYPWPGNVRELRNVIERAVVVCASDVITTDDLPLDRLATDERATRKSIPQPDSPAALERQRIVDALQACAGNQTHAAEMLGIARRTLVKRLSAYAVPRPRKR